MELYLFILVVLIILAISDLSVGVSNDAVNFLNSAVGSKAAPRYIIIITASVGILIGTTFSSGLMEVARKGIFNPEQFTFPEIMMIFLSVMLTILILLDLYNTFGLPTSTTVSIVFSLLGAGIALSIIKIYNTTDNISDLAKYINIGKATAIISGILLSVIIAFSVGAFFQFITRLIFTFDYNKRIKRYGAVWGSICLTLISYFILIKGAKGTSFLSEENIEWIEKNTELLLLYCFLFSAVVFQLLISFTRVNILRIIVLIGTFAIALSFAANDLVNFIGVPLAGLSAYNIAVNSVNPSDLMMEALRDPVQTRTFVLLLAGLIMIVTLWFSRKARTVTKTELYLGRQAEGFERFESSFFSRTLVRMNISLLEIIQKIIPDIVKKYINKRLDPSAYRPIKEKNEPAPLFDLLRATVNLTVASALISFATSLKLPLSTTYVTFMVAMGTSLSDKSWGRESAVYRVNGVITVIGGWFFTAFMALTISIILAIVIYYGHLIAIIILCLLAGYFIFKTHVFHRVMEKEEEELEKSKIQVATNGSDALLAWMLEVQKYLNSISKSFSDTLNSLYKEDRVKLRRIKKDSKKLKKQSTLLVSDIFHAVKLLHEDNLKGERRYGKIISSIQEMYSSLRNISQRCFDHVDNNHKKPSLKEIEDLKELEKILILQVRNAEKILASKDFSNLTDFEKRTKEFYQLLEKLDENQLERIKKGSSTSRGSLLFLGILSDTENISNHTVNLINSCRKSFGGSITKK
ncbi:MAG: hypothetical protein A2V66_02860 [Ignavibacteria bacterium RBG_13_36_8]|nr:MAG: hypothetical protein A2V66_02860 [Ignavibacteria bacterium RBG_13_36_8]